MIKCDKCGFLKLTGGKCACSIKIEIKSKGIPKISEKKKEEIKKRGSLKEFYKKLSDKHFDINGNGLCEFCGKKFNIITTLNPLTSFAHILPKGNVSYKHLVTYENNICIVCSEKCHTDLDATISKLKLRNKLLVMIEKGEKINLLNLKQYERNKI